MPSRHDGMENAKEGWEHYMYHKTSALSNMKVLKIEPGFQLLKPSCIHSPQGIPLTPNSFIIRACAFSNDVALLYS
jgi:hypothetical protein